MLAVSVKSDLAPLSQRLTPLRSCELWFTCWHDRSTPEFDIWLRRLRDERAKARIASRLQRLAFGNPGDCKKLGGGLMEMRVDYGPGYRVYFKWQRPDVVVLLCGGDKSSQSRDIERAQEYWSDYRRR